MKKLSLNRPGTLHHAAMSPFARPLASTGCVVGTRVDTPRAEVRYGDGSQQESQSKHPFLSRSSQNPYSSQTSQHSLPPGCTLTQMSQSSQRFSQNSQPEDYGCDQWRNAHNEKEMVGQQKPPSPYYVASKTNLGRQDGSGSRGGVQKMSSSPSSTALCLLGPQNSTTRPWPQCSVSEDLEQRFGNMEKLRMEEIEILQGVRDDYKKIKIFLEETCFESKDNRSKYSLQQNALHKLLKEEEAANRNIITGIRSVEDTFLKEIAMLKQKEVETGDSTTRACFSNLTETIREEMMKLKEDLKLSLQPNEQLESTLAQQAQQLAVLLSNFQNNFSEKVRGGLPVQSGRPAAAKSEVADRLLDFDSGLEPDEQFSFSPHLAKPITYIDLDSPPAPYEEVSFKTLSKPEIFVDLDPLVASDDDLRRSVRRKMLRAQRKVRRSIY